MNTPESSQPIVHHLIELRARLLKCMAVVLVLFVGLLFVSRDLYYWLSRPLLALLPEGSGMIATGVATPFTAPLKLAFVVSLAIAIPYILSQLWQFIAPGLYQKEKRLVAPLLVSTVTLFYLGIAFAYFLVFPLVFGFFYSVLPMGVEYMPDINHYLDTVLKLFFAFGLAFEVPVAIVLMIWAGVTTPEKLANNRPYVFIGCFVVAMLLTPPDVFSQILLAVPTWLLFEIGILIGKLFYSPAEILPQE